MLFAIWILVGVSSTRRMIRLSEFVPTGSPQSFFAAFIRRPELIESFGERIIFYQGGQTLELAFSEEFRN